MKIEIPIMFSHCYDYLFYDNVKLFWNRLVFVQKIRLLFLGSFALFFSFFFFLLFCWSFVQSGGRLVWFAELFSLFLLCENLFFSSSPC